MIVNLGFPEILGTVHGVNVPQPWFADRGYSGRWEQPDKVVDNLEKAKLYVTDSDDLGAYAYQSVIPYLDPFDPWVRSLGCTVRVENYKKFIAAGEKFIAPVPASEFGSAQWGKSVDTIHELQRFPSSMWRGAFPNDLLEALRLGQAFLLFYSLWEIGVYYPRDVEQFAKSIEIPESAIILATPNTNFKKLYESQEEKPHIIYWNSFLDVPWGIPPYDQRPEQYDRWKENYQNLFRPSKFLCLNRRWSAERLFIGGYLRSEHANSSIVSQGTNREVSFSDVTGQAACRDLREKFGGRSLLFNRIFRYYQKAFGDTKSICCSPDLDVAENMDNATWFAQDLQNRAYINIVTETCFPYNDGIFFTEKIYKPVWNLQPFLLVSAPHSLQRFRELGFKTFGQWWDESYDEIEDNQLRLEAICRVVDDLDKKSLEELHKMYLDMEDILEHNFRLFAEEAVLENYPRVQKQIFEILGNG